MAKQKTNILSPLAPVFTVLNWVAECGWIYVLLHLVEQFVKFYPELPPDKLVTDVRPTVLMLESICALEVLRMLLGDLPGNLILGVVLHSIRFVAITELLVRTPEAHWTGPAILTSWAVTEVTRYPMYMFPNMPQARSMRMVVPLVTFPLGAFSEAFGAYIVFVDLDTPVWLKAVTAAVLFVNGVLGPTMAYPALLKKGLPVIGFGPAGLWPAGLAKKRETPSRLVGQRKDD
jgi:hypothetical protein